MDGTPEARRLVLRPLSGKSQVSEASDALSGVELAHKTQPDLALLDSLPLALSGAPLPLVLHLASVGGLGPPAVFILSQWAAHPRWSKRLTGLPGLFCLSLGLMLNNTWAVLNAFFGRPEFGRTPEYNLSSAHQGWQRSGYVLKPDGMVWGQPANGRLCLARITPQDLLNAFGRTPMSRTHC